MNGTNPVQPVNLWAKEITMSTDVNKIIDNALGQVRSILVEAVEQVNEDARSELIEKFNQAVGTGTVISVKAPRVSVKTASKAKSKTTKKAKPKRVVSEATRKKLALNLKKARDAKAAKAKAPAKRKTKAKSKKK